MGLSTKDRALEISRCTLFAGIDRERLKVLAEKSSSDVAGEGDCLIIEGEKVTHLYIIITGAVCIYRNSMGRRLPIYEFRNYDYFGEFEIMGHFSSISDAEVASENVHYIAIDAKAFSEVVLSDPPIAERLMLDLCRRMKHRNEQFVALSTLRPSARLANAIYLDLSLHANKDKSDVFRMTLRPNLWARRTGASLGTVNTCFAKWRRANILQRVGDPSNCTYMVHRTALMAIIEGAHANGAQEEL